MVAPPAPPDPTDPTNPRRPTDPTDSTGAPSPTLQEDRDFIIRTTRWAIVGVLAIGGLLALLWVLKAALTPLAVAFVIAYLLDPLIDRFEARGVRRPLAIFVLLAGVGAANLAFLLFVIPRLLRELSALAERMPVYLDRFVTEFVPQLEARIGVQLPGTVAEALGQLRGIELGALASLRDLLTGTLATLSGTAGVLVALLVIPILAYYLLVEFDSLMARLGSWVPPRYRGYVFEKARTVDALIAGFLRGQLLVAGCLGVLYAVGFSIIGIDLAIGVGLLAGVMALIPYLGNVVAVGAATLLCVLQFGVDWHLAAVLGWYVVVQTLEGFVLTPRIVGHSVGLHPGVVIVALLIGGDLFGFLGLLIAVPAAAVVKVFAQEASAVYRQSALFGGEPDGWAESAADPAAAGSDAPADTDGR
jgi:predicted PurR-regulated permease PerM